MDKIKLIEEWFEQDLISSYKYEFRLKYVAPLFEDDPTGDYFVLTWWNGKKGNLAKIGSVCLLLDDIGSKDHLKMRWNNLVDTLKSGIKNA